MNSRKNEVGRDMKTSIEMQFVDTHCHLENNEFNEDREIVIKRAAEAGIHIISSAIDKDSWLKGLKIAEKHNNVYASLGLDPSNFGDCESAIVTIRENHKGIIAIGEIGLDHFRIRDHGERAEQEKAFRNLIELAIEYKLPIQVHSRSAGAKALAVLKDCNADLVHMHAFDGKSNYARKASHDLGYYFSIPTSVIRSLQKQKLVKAVNIERLLLETDSPVLGPEIGERNEPKNIGIALKEIASILRREEEEVREIVLENTLRLYSKIKFH